MLIRIVSISGSTSAIFAYLGEFIGSKNRSRSIMISSVIFGVFSLLLPVMAWLIINQNWSFVIPFMHLTYKPWRLFFLACGLPSFVSGLWMILFPESPKFTFSQVTFKNFFYAVNCSTQNTFRETRKKLLKFLKQFTTSTLESGITMSSS